MRDEVPELFMSIAGVHPWQYVTVASLVSAIVRALHMRENSPGLIAPVAPSQRSMIDDAWLQEHPSAAQGCVVDGWCEACTTTVDYDSQPRRSES